jgi:hypothetical protein
MYRLIYAPMIVATLFGVQIPTAAKASILSYNLTLTPILGPESGTGSLTITVPPVGSSGFLTLGNGLTAMDFRIDGLDFTLNNSSEVSYFYQGSNLVLASLGYSGAIGDSQLLSLSLGGFGAYFFSDNTPGEGTVGNVSVSATPLPTTLPLLATGLGGLGLFGWWRKRKASAVLAAA